VPFGFIDEGARLVARSGVARRKKTVPRRE
jgi:hypothetical protein